MKLEHFQKFLDQINAGAQENVKRGLKSNGQMLNGTKNKKRSLLLSALAKELGMHYLDHVSKVSIDPSLVEKIPLSYLKRRLFLPVQMEGKTLLVLSPDLLEPELKGELQAVFGAQEVKFIFCEETNLIELLHGLNRELNATPDRLVAEISAQELEEIERTSLELFSEENDAPVIKIVNYVLDRAVKTGASDVHFEPYEDKVRIRFRLDGILHDFLTLPKTIHSALISRIKVMAQLDIAEKRIPQDGRIEVKVGSQEIDLRVATLPTIFGERVVLRLLERSVQIFNLFELGMEKELLNQVLELLKLTSGIILVTGPTGSGKTTTLYAMLNYLNQTDKNILTVEDPVEYRLEGIGQLQVNPKTGLTFASALRSLVRQDPDVILVGEIRDRETAEISVQAALTGHLVFATLHTNDAASAVVRLIDMGIEPFLVSSAVKAVLSQRLVRILCPKCKQKYKPLPEERNYLNLAPEDWLFQPQGCAHCLHSGYKGRTGIFELMVLSEELRGLILEEKNADLIKRQGLKAGMQTLEQSGKQKVRQGLTSLSEVMRVIRALD